MNSRLSVIWASMRCQSAGSGLSCRLRFLNCSCRCFCMCCRARRAARNDRKCPSNPLWSPDRYKTSRGIINCGMALAPKRIFARRRSRLYLHPISVLLAVIDLVKVIQHIQNPATYPSSMAPWNVYSWRASQTSTNFSTIALSSSRLLTLIPPRFPNLRSWYGSQYTRTIPIPIPITIVVDVVL